MFLFGKKPKTYSFEVIDRMYELSNNLVDLYKEQLDKYDIEYKIIEVKDDYNIFEKRYCFEYSEKYKELVDLLIKGLLKGKIGLKEYERYMKISKIKHNIINGKSK